MSADGTFKISNDLDDKSRFKELMLEEDDSFVIGEPKKVENEFDDDGRGGGFGGGRGGGIGGR
jgi:hypothetical protein